MDSIKQMMLKTHAKGENHTPSSSTPTHPKTFPPQHLLPKSLPESKGKKEKRSRIWRGITFN